MKKYITGIDALRTLGVLAVIFYHIMPSTFVGGYLGVLIFFVLTGYLVTDSLLRERETTGRISWGTFLVKRARRIYPLLFFIFLFFSLLFNFLQPYMLSELRTSFLSSVLFVNNFWQIQNGASYFANFVDTANNAFKHTYFLALEVQFYLFIAVFLTFLPKKKRLNVLILLVLSVISAFLMAFLFKADDPTRVYYGTDTRLFSLLIGAALAFAFRRHSYIRSEGIFAETLRRAGSPVAFLLFSLIIVSLFAFDDKNVFMYRGGMYLFSLLVAAVIFLLAHPELSVNKYFSNPLFSYIGSRSYAIYLAQLPILIFFENYGVNSSLWFNIIWELPVIFIFAELSYRQVERPINEFTFEKFKFFCKTKLTKVDAIPFYALLPLTIAGALIIATAPGQAEDISELQQTMAIAKKETTDRNKALASEAKPKTNASEVKEAKPETPSSSSSASEVRESIYLANAEAVSVETAGKAAEMSVVAIGDSVLLDIAASISYYFPKMYIDGDVGRHASDGVYILQSVDSAILSQAQAFLINLGINGNIAVADVDNVMAIAGERPVYWVNDRVPRPWQQENNTLLANVAPNYPNLHILDWYAVSEGHPEYFVSDQVHLTLEGARIYTNLLTNSIAGN